MKKRLITLSLLIVGTTYANENFSNEEKKKKDSTEIVSENGFNLSYQESSHFLQVEITNNADSLAGISIANQRGFSLMYQIVDTKDKQVEFDLSKLEKGTYNVMYISNQEIRIKKIQVN